jgi:hypothetical protein
MKKNIFKVILGVFIIGGIFTIYKSNEVKGDAEIICDYPRPMEITEVIPVSTCNQESVGETISIKVRNNVSSKVNDRKLELNYDGKTLDTIEIGEIEPEGSKEIQYTIKDSNINYKDVNIVVIKK